MKKTNILTLFLIGITYFAVAQVNYTANDQIPAYNGQFRAGVNPGYYGGNWDNFNLTELAAGNAAVDIKGTGVRAIRGTLPEYFGIVWDYNNWIPIYEFYQALGVEDNALVVGVAHPDHRDPVDYCPNDPVETDMFANLYEPIWDNGENGTPVNDNNYMARYVYDLVQTVGDHVKFWEVWNEPGYDLTGYKSALQPGQPGNWYENDPEPCDIILRAPISHYIRTLRITYEVIKTLSPDDYVVLSGIGTDAFLHALLRNTDNPNGGQVTSEFPYKSGAYFDVVGFHAYPHFDGSTQYWDNDLNQMVFTRHSDGAVEGFQRRVDQRQDLLAEFGYDGSTYPNKLLIVTELNVPRVPFGNYFGSDLLQRNFIIKSLAHATKIGVLQTHVWQLADRTTEANATGSFDQMGFYEYLNDLEPYQQVIRDEGIAHHTVSDLLADATFSQAETDLLNLPDNVGGWAYQKTDNTYIYVLWAKTQIDMSEAGQATYSFPASFGSTVDSRAWNFAETQTIHPVPSQNIVLNSTPVFFTKSANTGVLTLTCPAGNLIEVPAPETDGGAFVDWDQPTASTTCPGGNVTITSTGGQSGDFFPFGNNVISYTATDDCGNTSRCAMRVAVASSGGINEDCHINLWNFKFAGQRDGHKYFISKYKVTWPEAKAIAESYGAHLLSIESQGENDYLRYQFTDVGFIGLNDAASEGNLVWDSGEPVDFTAFDNCSWCESNTSENDYTEFHPWNGQWSFNDGSVPQYFMMEMDCSEPSNSGELTVNCPSNIVETTTVGMNIQWDPPTASTTCPTGNVTFSQTAGPPSGAYFEATGQPITISYLITDQCNNSRTCSFTVTVQDEDMTDCPPSIPGFTVIGEYNGHKYFLSENEDNWNNNKNFAEANGGYLAVINDPGENQFLQNMVSNMVHFGLNDYQSEGQLSWVNQDPVNYTNLSECDWCGLNSANYDYGLFLPWDGTWAFDQQWATRLFIMEVDCSSSNSGELTVSCPADISTTADVGTHVYWDSPTASTTCTSGSVTITQTQGPTSGSLFDATGQPVTIAYLITDACGNAQNCQFTVTVSDENTSGCPPTIDGYSLLGEYQNHQYYLSNDVDSWSNNQQTALSNGGYLAVIDGAAENNFLQAAVQELVHFGLHDSNTEGNVEWVNNNPVSYTNYSDCEWCGLNTETNDHGLFLFWDGKWSFDHPWAQRKHILEMECGTSTSQLSVSCPSNINMTADGGSIVSWNEPVATTNCPSGNIDLTQTAGPASGSFFDASGQPVTITYEVTDGCGNIQTCSFTVTVNNLGGGCPSSLPGYSYLGMYNGHAYFLSENIATWESASILAQAENGYLATINDAQENEFLRSNINSYTYIGLNDAAQEGSLTWANGHPVTYNNTDNTNNDENDYAVMNFWDGDWSFLNQWVHKRYILEMDCAESQPLRVDAPNSIVFGLYPNPAKDLMTAQFMVQTSTTSQITVMDVFGRAILRERHRLEKGSFDIDFDLTDIPAGIYYMLIETDTMREKLKFVKM